MDPSEWAALLAMCVAVSFTPGPNTTLSTAMAANLGLHRALRFCMAVPVGWAILLVLCGKGLGLVIMGTPPLRWLIQMGGVAYMLWLAWKLSRTEHLSPVDATRLQVGFFQGVGLQFLNVKAWMLALTLTGGWVIHANGQLAVNPTERLVQVVGVGMVFAFCSNFTYACVGSALRNWLAQGQRLRRFNLFMAMILFLTALWMLRT
ncbi:MAG: LysE family translocator [Betaproteobacteria bacterium]|nr:LysE family translocator [Betaproteobacteria bacterium]NBY06254.1 LysE family translocator [Betaproteobacteria bacterium]